LIGGEIEPKVILITGAAGFIGSHLVDRLSVDGHSVVGVDDLSSGKRENVSPQFDLRELDVCSPELRNVVREVRPDVVYHLAAQISVSVSAREPEFDADVNIKGSLNLLEGIREAALEKTRFVYITSGGTAYGAPEVLPADETTPVRPLSPYGVSKLAVEQYLPVYENLAGLSYGIVRLANIYGPRQDPHGEAGVVAIFSRAMLNGTPLQIFGDGNDERDYVYVSDVVDAILKVGDSDLAGPYNVGTAVGTSTNRIFELLARYTDHSEEALHGPNRPGDINKIALDSGKAKRELGWEPQVSLEEGLKRSVEWFKENP